MRENSMESFSHRKKMHIWEILRVKGIEQNLLNARSYSVSIRTVKMITWPRSEISWLSLLNTLKMVEGRTDTLEGWALLHPKPKKGFKSVTYKLRLRLIRLLILHTALGFLQPLRKAFQEHTRMILLTVKVFTIIMINLVLYTRVCSLVRVKNKDRHVTQQTFCQSL